jgi:hypothetical protein
VLFVDEPRPSTRTQTIRSAQLTNIFDAGFISLSPVLRLLPLQRKQRFALSLGSSMIFRTKAALHRILLL